MNCAGLHRFTPILVTVAVLGIIVCLPVRIAQGDDSAVIRTNKPTATIVAGVSVSQEFPAKGAEIRSLGLFVSRYGSVTRGTMQITIDAQRDGQWQTVSSKSIPIAALGDPVSDPYMLNFSQPLAVSINQPMRITVQSSEADPASAIQWWSNPDFTPDGYVARVNGKQQAGILCFAVTYQPRTGRLIGLLGPAWHRVTIFLNTGWQVLLLAGFGTVMVGLFVCASLLLRTVGGRR